MTIRAWILAAAAAVAVVPAGEPLRAAEFSFERFIKTTRAELRKVGMKRHDVEVGPNRVVYFTGGDRRADARTIVLVHGVNDQAGSWAPVIAALAREFRVVAIDLPGHGESGPKAGPLPMRGMIDAVKTVVEVTSPHLPVVLVGNSMGGWVSILYASEAPARVSHLVLEDASGMMWDISHVPMFPKTREEALRLLRLVHGPDAAIPPSMADAMLANAATMPQARVLQAGVIDWLVDSRLSTLTMPVTLVWGAHDGMLTLDYARAMEKRIPIADLRVIGAAAHIPHRQTPGDFTKTLLEVLR